MLVVVSGQKLKIGSSETHAFLIGLGQTARLSLRAEAKLAQVCWGSISPLAWTQPPKGCYHHVLLQQILPPS